jgi:hypothetical protein
MIIHKLITIQLHFINFYFSKFKFIQTYNKIYGKFQEIKKEKIFQRINHPNPYKTSLHWIYHYLYFVFFLVNSVIQFY